MNNFISDTQTDLPDLTIEQAYKAQIRLRRKRRRMAATVAVMIFMTAFFILNTNPSEPVIASDAATRTNAPTVVATRTPIALPTNPPTEPLLRNPNFLKDTSLIDIDESCDAPCWHGITPGETKYVDALVILQDDPEFSDPLTQAIPGAFPAVGTSWQPIGGDPCCQIVAEDGVTVASIFLQLAPDMTVKQVIDVRGVPEYVLGTAGTPTQAIINMFYPEQNMIVFAFVAGAETGKLSEASEILGVYYTTPDRMALGVKLSSLYGWKGYQPFSAYVPDPENWGTTTPDYKVTQSVTLTPTGGTATPRPSS